jgi:hypothetical protein
MNCGLLSKWKFPDKDEEEGPPIKLAPTSSPDISPGPTQISRLPSSRNCKANTPSSQTILPTRPTSHSLFQTFIQLCLCESCKGRNARQKCQRRSCPRPLPMISLTEERVSWGMGVALSPRVERVETRKQDKNADGDEESP